MNDVVGGLAAGVAAPNVNEGVEEVGAGLVFCGESSIISPPLPALFAAAGAGFAESTEATCCAAAVAAKAG